MVKSRLKKVPQSARLSAGGGVIAIWAMPKDRCALLKGASLTECSSELPIRYLD